MKKLLLIAALAFLSVAMNAQGLEGKWFVGGQAGYSHSKTKFGAGIPNAKSDSYTILPIVGTFITPDVAVGAQVGYAGSKADKAKSNQIIIAPLARKYWNISGGLFFFGQAALPISFGDVNFDEDGEVFDKKAKTLGVNIALSPGFDYIINGKFSIETSFNILTLGYNNYKHGDTKTDSFGFFANEGSKFGELRIGAKFIF